MSVDAIMIVDALVKGDPGTAYDWLMARGQPLAAAFALMLDVGTAPPEVRAQARNALAEFETGKGPGMETSVDDGKCDMVAAGMMLSYYFRMRYADRDFPDDIVPAASRIRLGCVFFAAHGVPADGTAAVGAGCDRDAYDAYNRFGTKLYFARFKIVTMLEVVLLQLVSGDVFDESTTDKQIVPSASIELALHITTVLTTLRCASLLGGPALSDVIRNSLIAGVGRALRRLEPGTCLVRLPPVIV